MDKCVSDAEFDSYWDYEAKNKNRNRIRVGRQYQASVPPLLKPGEKDGRKSEDLETLKWKPNQLSDQEIDQYFSMAKAVSSFAKALDNCRDPDKSRNETLHAAIKGLTEFVTSHHPCHRDSGCKVPPSSSSCPSASDPTLAKSPTSNDWTAPEAHLFAQAIESCGKNFCAIKKEYLPWKPVCSLIEYYYYYGKGEKVSSPIHVPSVCKVEKKELPDSIEAVASCSHDCSQQVLLPCAKEEPLVSEDVKTEMESLATLPDADSPSKIKRSDGSPANEMETEDGQQSTVGSLKFFLGGRLVLKLNAQQEGGTKCQWVQSNESLKHAHQMRKVKHRRKEMAPPDTTESPKHKKKMEDHAAEGAFSSNKKAKLKPYSADTSLCSMSWTPPVADGPDSAELEDASSSKTSEGCVSPVVMSSRGVKTESADAKRKMSDLTDQDRKPSWLQTAEGYSEEYGSVSGFDKSLTNSASEDACNSYEVHNHKSALNRVKGFQPRVAHSSSPCAKVSTKWPSPCGDSNDKLKSSQNIHTPSPKICNSSSESITRDLVLDLSGKLETFEDGESTCCQQTSPMRCSENCSSSEGSPRTPCSANECTSCCKSSNCSAYQTDGTALRESDAESLMEAELANHKRVIEQEGCYNASTSCASPKCYKSYSSKEQLCNKEDSTMMNANSSPNSVASTTDDAYSKKLPTWFGNNVVQMYPQCYPYYVTYGANPSTSNNSPTSEIPLDLSNSSSKKEERLLLENVPLGDLAKNSADAVDRGMLYQLLKNKVTK